MLGFRPCPQVGILWWFFCLLASLGFVLLSSLGSLLPKRGGLSWISKQKWLDASGPLDLGRMTKSRVGVAPSRSRKLGASFGVQQLSCILVLIFLSSFRIGEASHPGPKTVKVGVFNPSGLTSKLDVTASLPGDVWVASETMLTSHGVDKLRKGLRSLKSAYKWVVPGFPCASRTTSQVGIHSGVLLLSKHPARALPHAFDAETFAQSRIQVAGVCVGNAWIQLGMLYGFPNGLTHQSPAFQTDSLLEQLVDRIAVNASGLRIIAGDVNHEPHELSQLRRSQSLGFREAQDVGLYSWGQPVESTSRGFRRLDQMWLSPEVVALVQAVHVDHAAWPDHSSVCVELDAERMRTTTFQWRIPRQLAWPDDWNPSVDFNPANDLTVEYANLWQRLEQEAAVHQTQLGHIVPAAQLGRGQTLDTCKVTFCPAPCRTSRAGEEQPLFFGASLTYNRWFKQLRRLQALMRARKPKAEVTLRTASNVEKTWQAVCQAPGFGCGFRAFWALQGCAPVFPHGLPVLCPSAVDVEQMFASFQVLFRAFERKLASSRYQGSKRRRLNDLNCVFGDCKSQQTPAVDTLVQRLEVEVEEVRSEDLSVVLREPVAVDLSRPVVIGGSPVQVIEHCHDQLWLESVDNLHVGSLLTQETVHLTDAAIIEQFQKTWEPRWRKLDHLLPSQWDQILNFCKAVLRPIEWNLAPWTSDRVRGIIKSKKVRAAVGPDGVSIADLKSLPPSGVDAVAAMFRAVEGGKEWPSQLTTGFVSSLAKLEQPGCADDYRPITVYPLLYRIWSSGRSREALSDLSKVVPHSIQGGLPGRHPKVIWYELALTLEWAHATHAPLQGIVVDLRKAFNSVPRLPIWQCLHLLGFPEGVARAWATFVSVQARRFKVRQSVSSPVHSCTGYPEGCGLSVFAFAILDWLLDFWVRSTRGHVQLRSYVDDWHLTFPEVRHCAAVWDSLMAFARALDLEIDPNKSFAWAAQCSDRSLLKEGPLAVALSARALGAHHNFCYRKGNWTLVKRITGMKATWVRLRQSTSPYKFKLLALTVMAWPRALHGVSVVPLGVLHYQSLRSGAMKGLRTDRIGANPILHLVTDKWTADPELWAIIQTLRDAREFGGFDRVGTMLAWLACIPAGFPANGPSAVLLERLCRLGWSVDSNGLVSDDLGSFDLFHAPWEEVLFRVRRAWPSVMQFVVQHRQSLQGLHRADIDELHTLMRKYGPVDQVYLRCHLDGTVYTTQCKAHFKQGVTDRCPYCQVEKDSFFHRAWTCPSFASVRPSIASDVQMYIDSAPACQVCHGWPIRTVEEDELVKALLQVPQPGCPELPQGCPDNGVLDLFVDGTARHGDDPKLRLAAWAVTLAGTTTGGIWDNKILSAGHVRGILQTSFRAELDAVLMAIRVAVTHRRRVRIWSDCLSVVRGVKRVLAGRFRWQINKPHSEAWRQLSKLLSQLPEGWVQMVKVVSHACLEAADSEIQRWAYFHNQLADAAASGANERRPAIFLQRWSACQAAVQFQRKVQNVIFQVHLRTGRESDRRDKVKPVKPRVLPGDEDVPKIRVPAAWPYPARLEKKYCFSNIQALHAWWIDIGARALQSDGPLVWVSGTSLFLDFLATTGVEGPFVYKLKWFDSFASLPQPDEMHFVARTRSFLWLLKMYLKEMKVVLPSKMAKPHSSAICFWMVCYRMRWDLRRLDEIDNCLFDQFGCQLTTPVQLQKVEPFQFPVSWRIEM